MQTPMPRIEEGFTHPKSRKPMARARVSIRRIKFGVISQCVAILVPRDVDTVFDEWICASLSGSLIPADENITNDT